MTIVRIRSGAILTASPALTIALLLVAPARVIPAVPGKDASPVQTSTESTLSCRPLGKAESARHSQLTKLLREATVERQELPEGYAFRVNSAVMPYLQLAEWVNGERRCCPFLAFTIRLAADAGPLWLDLTGSPEARELIRTEFVAE